MMRQLRVGLRSKRVFEARFELARLASSDHSGGLTGRSAPRGPPRLRSRTLRLTP